MAVGDRKWASRACAWEPPIFSNIIQRCAGPQPPQPQPLMPTQGWFEKHSHPESEKFSYKYILKLALLPGRLYICLLLTHLLVLIGSSLDCLLIPGCCPSWLHLHLSPHNPTGTPAKPALDGKTKQNSKTPQKPHTARLSPKFGFFLCVADRHTLFPCLPPG